MLTNNQQDFAEGCPELGFAIPFDSEDIDQAVMLSAVC